MTENRKLINLINSTKKAYGKIAYLTLEESDLVLINSVTGCYHKFVTGEERIRIDKKQIKEVRELYETTQLQSKATSLSYSSRP